MKKKNYVTYEELTRGQKWVVTRIKNLKTVEEKHEAIRYRVEKGLPIWFLSPALIDLTDLSFLFRHTKINEDLSRWDTSDVTNMEWMFGGAKCFNQNISGWDVSKVTNMQGMFNGAKSFNQDISGWDVSNVTDTGYMFSSAKSFNQDIGGWDLSKVRGMWGMFMCAKSFNQDISGWNIGYVSRYYQIFDSCPISEEFKPLKLAA